MNRELLIELERLNGVLGAMRDTIRSGGTTDMAEEELDALIDNVVVVSAMLREVAGDRSGIERLVRLNRELTAQLDTIRSVVGVKSEANLSSRVDKTE